jgi:hypothetical protein
VGAPFDILLARWANFYVIAGSSSAALMGLQFVVIALSADTRAPANAQAFAVFNTPTVVHFATVLLVAAVVNAPWPSVGSLSATVGVVGAAGVIYMAMMLVAMRRQKAYRMVLEDRIWHAILPLVAYGDLIAASVILRHQTAAALFAVAAAALLLLFIGVHNAWDNATYVALQHLNRTAANTVGAADTDTVQPDTTATGGDHS